MNSLASRKKLLIAESELNRLQLVEEWQAMTDEVHALTKRAATFGSCASIAASLIAGLALCCRKKSALVAERPSWWRTLLKGAQLVIPLWLGFRTQPKQ
jgi:hypothetical protein